MSLKAIRMFLCFGLLMTFTILQADVLKKKFDGTIAAVGHFNGADDNVIYWTTCEGGDTTFVPRKEYVYKPGSRDCNPTTTNDKNGGPGANEAYSKKHKAEKGGWLEVPVTKHH
jgi:hypothetical protein